MGAVGERRQASMTRHIESRGENTTVNGETVKAIWQDVGVIAVQRFLSENEWAKSAFQLRLPYYALSAPYSVVNGCEVIRQGLSWRGVVRDITTEGSEGVISQVNALVVLTTE